MIYAGPDGARLLRKEPVQCRHELANHYVLPLRTYERCKTTQYTLAECLAWGQERSAVVSVVGGELALPEVQGLHFVAL